MQCAYPMAAQVEAQGEWANTGLAPSAPRMAFHVLCGTMQRAFKHYKDGGSSFVKGGMMHMTHG